MLQPFFIRILSAFLLKNRLYHNLYAFESFTRTTSRISSQEISLPKSGLELQYLEELNPRTSNPLLYFSLLPSLLTFLSIFFLSFLKFFFIFSSLIPCLITRYQDKARKLKVVLKKDSSFIPTQILNGRTFILAWRSGRWHG